MVILQHEKEHRIILHSLNYVMGNTIKNLRNPRDLRDNLMGLSAASTPFKLSK